MLYFEGYGPGYDPTSLVMADGQPPGLQPGLIQRMKEGRQQRGLESQSPPQSNVLYLCCIESHFENLDHVEVLDISLVN